MKFPMEMPPIEQTHIEAEALKQEEQIETAEYSIIFNHTYSISIT